MDLSGSGLMYRARTNGAWAKEDSESRAALLCSSRACSVPVSSAMCLVMTLPDPNASGLRPIFSFAPLAVTSALLHKLQSGVREKSLLPSFHTRL